jgi:hypothetical protein
MDERGLGKEEHGRCEMASQFPIFRDSIHGLMTA